MSDFSRRDFFKTTAGAIGALGATPAFAAKRSATDLGTAWKLRCRG
jgi:hypothetical protein